MSYNVENLFDIEDDPHRNDNEFLPEAKRAWTAERYDKKILGIAKNIIALGEWDAVGIVALCEIENEKVLLDLVSADPIKQHHYGIIHHESPDPRGIDVAILYHPEKFLPLYEEAIKVNVGKTRDILYVKGIAMDKDTLHLFMNHWSSRVGGQHQTEHKRIAIANILKNKVDSIIQLNGESKIVVMGDFNDTPQDKSLLSLCEDSLLINKMSEATYFGTYKYKGNWDYLDQFLVSKALNSKVKKVDVFRESWLLQEGASGEHPFRTYQGPIYKGGYSDHLPIYIDLLLN